MSATHQSHPAPEPPPIRASVFGKKGCDKCAVLRKRAESCVSRTAPEGVELRYLDIETEDGLVAFCRAEGLNPQRIPALLLEAYDAEMRCYRPIPRPKADTESVDALRLPRLIGIQTDYTDRGKGVIPPRAIQAEITAALDAVGHAATGPSA